MPRGVAYAYLFQIFNSSSWSFILGTPMLLFLKALGAPASILGAAIAMTPLFGVLQIPAAKHAERIGYKRFMIRGWATRSVFLLGLAVVALLPERVRPDIRIGLTLAMMACFAAARGISVCGLMPWFTQLIPEPKRGAFIARDTTSMYLALTVTMLFSSWFVGAFPAVRAFGFLFLLSYGSALVALMFLRLIPDAQPAQTQSRKGPPPWKEMLLYPPFFRFISYNVVYCFFTSALGVIWIPFMRDGIGASERLVLGISAYSCVVCAAASLLAGPVADRTGSRPVMGLASGLILLSQCCWMLMAAGVLPSGHPWLFGVVTIGSVGYPVLTLASTRMLMGIIPAMGRSHFFAIAGVASGLTLGLMPICWGFALDWLGRAMGRGFTLITGWTWNRYSIGYAAVLCGTLACQFFRHRLDEPRAMSTEEFLRILLIQSPVRLAARVLAPLRNFQWLGG